MDTKAIVDNTGAVIFLPYITFSTFCSFDFTAFPYDKQTCQIIYGSETYSKDQMNIGHSGKKFHQTDELDIEDHSSVDSGDPYYEHNQWTVLSTKGSIKAKHYKCCPGEIWETLIIRVTAQRNANYYRYVFVTSAVVFAIMVPLVFALPVDSPQKINLGKTMSFPYTLIFTCPVCALLKKAEPSPFKQQAKNKTAIKESLPLSKYSNLCVILHGSVIVISVFYR